MIREFIKELNPDSIQRILLEICKAYNYIFIFLKTISNNIYNFAIKTDQYREISLKQFCL